MAYRKTEQELKDKPRPIACNNTRKLKARITQLKRDKARQPNINGVVRKWTDRKADLLNTFEERLVKGNS